MHPEYFNDRNSKKFKLDNLYKKHLPISYICLDQKYKINI